MPWIFHKINPKYLYGEIVDVKRSLDKQFPYKYAVTQNFDRAMHEWDSLFLHISSSFPENYPEYTGTRDINIVPLYIVGVYGNGHPERTIQQSQQLLKKINLIRNKFWPNEIWFQDTDG